MESLIYFLIWAAAFFFMMRFGCGAHVMGHGHSHRDSRDPNSNSQSNSSDAAARWTSPEKAVDPVCRMNVATANAKSAVYEGHVYYFCSQECRNKFETDPHAYLEPNAI